MTIWLESRSEPMNMPPGRYGRSKVGMLLPGLVVCRRHCKRIKNNFLLYGLLWIESNSFYSIVESFFVEKTEAK